jgi:hypothetical protein
MTEGLTIETTSDTGLAAEKPKVYGDSPADPGPLMGEIETPEGMKKVAHAATKMWEARDPFMSQFIAQWKLNAARRRGITSGKLVLDSDQHWTAWFPEDASPDMAQDSNKLASLCRKFPSIMLADPPAPHVEPLSGEDEDEDAAEFSTRALINLQGQKRLRTIAKLRQALTRACDFGSGFIYYYVDPQGGGRVPVEVLAHPMATHIDNATVNPETGFEQGPYLLRYVRQDGTLTNDEAEAATKWAKDVRSEVITGLNARPIPHTATHIDEAYGIQIGVFDTFGRLKQRFPDLDKITVEEKKQLFQFKPEYEDVIKAPGSKNLKEDDDDERLVFVLTTIYEQTSEYEEGLYLVTLSNCYVAHRQKWVAEVDGKTQKLMLPIAQIPQFDEGRDTFYKVGLSEILGGANEVRAAQLAAQLDWLDKLNNQKIFIPLNSVIDPKQLQYGRATALYVNPGGEPSYQNLPPYPRESLDMRNAMTDDMNDASGLQEAGQALQDPNVKSGRLGHLILSQVHAGLSEPREGLEGGYLRCCRIELQMARAFLTDTQRTKFTGEDGAYKEEKWRGSDLVGESDIKLKPGSLSLLAPSAKAQFTEHLFSELQLISADEAKDMISSNLGALIGLQDDPFKMRVRSQIHEWKKGPPEGWQEKLGQAKAMLAEQQQVAATIGVTEAVPLTPDSLIVQTDMMSGVRILIDPVLAKIWEPVRVDTLPNIAQMRLNELAKLQASRKYKRWSLDWRLGVDVEIERMLSVVQGMAAAQQAQPGAGRPEPSHPDQQTPFSDPNPKELVA